MECGNMLLVALVLVQCCTVFCYSDNYFDQKHKSYDVYYDDSYLFHSLAARMVVIVVSAVINIFFLGVVFLCIRYCCPTCCRKVRTGYVIDNPALMMHQHPLIYYPNAPPAESVQLLLHNKPPIVNQQQSMMAAPGAIPV